MTFDPVGVCQKAGQVPPKGWLEPDPEGTQLASFDLSILQESKSNNESVKSAAMSTKRANRRWYIALHGLANTRIPALRKLPSGRPWANSPGKTPTSRR